MFFLNLIPPTEQAGQPAVQPLKPGRAKTATPKEPSALKKAFDKLSLRERIMLAALAVIAVVAVVVFLVVLPALNQISELEAEVSALQQQKSEVHIEPDRTAEYQEAYDAAVLDFENYRRFYYPFMDPETIDRTVTNMLLANDLEPVLLTMSTLQLEVVPGYSAAQTLVPRPVPVEEDEGDEAKAEGAEGEAGAGAEGAEGEAGAGAEGAEGEAGAEGAEDEAEGSRSGNLAAAAEDAGGLTDESSTEGEAPEGSLIYCYTVNVEATGWMYQMFSFLESARSITAMEIVSYSYKSPEEVSLSTAKTGTAEVEEPEGGTIIMQIKLYVFVGGELTATGTNAS
ncbi:MAG: type II secretion system protein M [Coriobacteriales bacterium]|jgi:cell division protein FtsL|nr:type II secretion system protein M [Coriobacteriales bacterium]